MTEPPIRRRPHFRAIWLLIGLISSVGFVALYLWAVRTRAGQEWDIQVFARLQSPGGVVEAAASVLRWLLPTVLAALCTVLALIRLRTGRFEPIVIAVIIGVLSISGAGVLRREVLSRPDLGDHGYWYNTYPSGHVAATAALAAAVLLLMRDRRWRLGLTLAPVVVSACFASVIGHAHRPSDALGAVLLVMALTAVALVLGPTMTTHSVPVSRLRGREV